MKRIALIKFDDSDNPWMVYKDVGMFLYELAKDYKWDSKYLYFNTIYNNTEWNCMFAQYVKPICLGNAVAYKEQIKLAKTYLKKYAMDIDVLMLFNYGSTVWKIARLAKKVNPKIVVYSKLDMGHGGYKHFVNQRFANSVKIWFEKIKSKYVDFFSVETKLYFESLKKLPIFKNRIIYLPNGVSLLDVDINTVEKNYKENIVITLGRLGDYAKHNELLLDAISLLPDTIINTWKFYFVGPSTKEFELYLKDFINNNPKLKNSIVLTGKITDRTELYTLCKRSKIVCMTSRTESVCIAVLEAMYFGAYPVLTDYSAFVLDATNQKRLGCVTEQNKTSVSKSLMNIMQNPHLEELNLACQKYARKHFDYKYLAGVLDGIIKKYT
ncbi:glycosyltransferase family 1 protein [Mitsuokella sp. AF33-22]|uniref:glycosyltransferase n=1 Tax=Mitsuokella sp. AF33-22 TaxID=2292047 RepID=UPI000E4BAC52|nr:glycosyltransferase [Mitsuokella sp. AF33-22]RHM57120.1 glycosyltransferase family 1 protein [Mitsuokella sp. AF33-22]